MVGAGERDEEQTSASAGGTPTPPPFEAATMDPSRALGAWRSWLTALATDAEAALAAAMTYASLAGEARDAWLDALDRDRGSVAVPLEALYAPLLAVEADDSRRARIEHAMAAADPSGGGPKTPRPSERTARARTRALRGTTKSGDVVCAVATPLYLDFVELLVCRYRPDRGVFTAHHEPFRHADQVAATVASALEQSIDLEPASLRDVIEELAHAVVADRREGRVAPDALARFSHLFGPDLEEDRPSA
jgi:hypothetical protein